MEEGLLILGQEPHIAPGVRGYTMEIDGELYVPLVIADRPGNGDVGRYLDGLPTDHTVKFPNVISDKLRGMLLCRGFIDSEEWAPEWHCMCDVMVRRGQARAGKAAR